MHHRRGTGTAQRGMTTPKVPESVSRTVSPLVSPIRLSALPLCAFAAFTLAGCVSATDPTLMAGNQAFAPSQDLSMMPDNSALAQAEGSADGEDANAAFSIAESSGENSPDDASTETAMAAPPSGETNIDALNRGITQSSGSVAVANLYSTEQSGAVPVPTTSEGGETATGMPVPAPAPGRQLGDTQPVEVAALSAPQEQSPATQALERATDGATAVAAPAESQPARPVALAEPPKKKSFFGRLFGSEPSPPKAVPASASKSADGGREVVSLRNDIRVARASANAAPAPSESSASSSSSDGGGLPGVRLSSLFEIQTGNDEDAENAQGVEVASAAGLARLAPNGLHVQTEKVDIACLKPRLVRTLKAIERHYGKPVVVTSGFRSPKHNRKIGGARSSRHTTCEAADIQISGVSKWDLAAYVRSLPGRGGVGTYCHTRSVHVDIGPKRDWNWRCRRRKG